MEKQISELVKEKLMNVGDYYKISYIADKRSTESAEVLARCIGEQARYYVLYTITGYTLCASKQDLFCGHMKVRAI